MIADFVAQRTGEPAVALIPQTIAHASLGVAIAAYGQWLDGEDQLTALLDAGMRGLADAFSASHPDVSP
ncbi:MAG TPA: hypothetical protein VGH27_00755 [Streptosporangiaceae bacterium]